MKERPIFFNAPMVRAILSDQKTQERWPGRLVCALTLMSIVCAVITVYLKS